MTDRELLEAAARAAGIGGGWGEVYHLPHGEIDCTDLWFLEGDENPYVWNPLTDEGDRYRLLKALKMGIDFDAQSVIYTLDGSICEESFRDDGDDARAVLRAAAAIGRAMQ